MIMRLPEDKWQIPDDVAIAIFEAALAGLSKEDSDEFRRLMGGWTEYWTPQRAAGVYYTPERIKAELDRQRGVDTNRTFDELFDLAMTMPPLKSDDIDRMEQEAKARKAPPQPLAKPKIIDGVDEMRVVDEAIAALSKSPELMQRGGSLVHIIRDAKPPKCIRNAASMPQIASIQPARIQELLSDLADWVKIVSTKDGPEERPIHPPGWVVKAVTARGQWKQIRPIEGVVQFPVLRSDGSVLQEPGYDPETGLIYEPAVEFPEIPAHPCHDDALRARDELLEIVTDFPFARPEHRAAWLAAALTPVAKYAIGNQCPIIAVDANCPGTGKSKLVDSIALIYTGATMPRTSAPPNDEEMHKTVTAVTLAGYPLVLFDNVAVTFGWPSLDGAVTGETWSARILGQSKMTGSLPLASTWFCTGNNLIFGSDVIRRVLHIRLHTTVENPENRADFKHPNLIQWVKQERPRLAVAAVTILRAYYAAGCPEFDLPVWGSFETWSLIRKVVVWLGLPDPALTRQELHQSSDKSGGELRQVIAGWEEADSENRGMTVNEVLQRLEHSANDLLTGGADPLRALRAAISQFTKPGQEPNAKSIGMRLHHMKGRICGGKFLKREDGDYGAVWSIGHADSPSGTTGTTGTNLTPINTRETNFNNRTVSGGAAAARNSPCSPSSPEACQHQYDGFVDSATGRKQVCSKCGKFYGYVRDSA